MLKHSKKRNTGLLHEFFTRHIAQCILENTNESDRKIKIAKNILKKYYHKDSNLYKEFKLFEALYQGFSKDRQEAFHLVEKIKSLAVKQNATKLEVEKSLLLKEMNGKIDLDAFFNQNVPDYKIHATIQVLLNHWRSNDLFESIQEETQLENKLIEHLLKDKKENQMNDFASMTNVDINRLVVNIMADKFNKKFTSELNEEQKKIIKLYAFKDQESCGKELAECLSSLQEKAKKEIPNKSDNGKLILEQVNKPIHSINDVCVSFYLGVSKLLKEIEDSNVIATA